MMNQPQSNEGERDRVRRAAAKLRENEDFNMAMKLQEAEFEQHYDRNRSERRVVGSDTRHSRAEQESERRDALERHLRSVREQAAEDEALARRLQAEMEAEDARRFARMTQNDEALARRLSADQSGGFGVVAMPSGPSGSESEAAVVASPLPYEDDERLARELQERYLRRLNGARGTLDRRTQQELQYYVGNNTLPHPSTLSLTRPRNSSANLGPPLDELSHVSPDMVMPPLPSYTEACTPTTPTLSIDSVPSRLTTSPSISRPTSILQSNDFNNQSVRSSVPSIDSPLPEPPIEILIQSNFNSINRTNNSMFNATCLSHPTQAHNNFHPTNPFLQDLMMSDYTTHNAGSPLAKDAPSTLLNDGRRLPEGAIPILPGLSAEQLASALPRNPSI